ncbi:hypothetical protein [Mangrovibacter yixingensis]|uniref:hypothetical protein n=1 Tax=Mangrovibacter yixingensis TaxID=1529639 RepID=UPI001CFB5E76|nr:hypothetical protein [Mangrovibacter yixingensis]
MATNAVFTQSLLTLPVSDQTDFTVLARHCEHLAETLLECADPLLHRALCEKLNTSLSLLRPTLLEPIPAHLVDCLTTDSMAAENPAPTTAGFAPDSEQLCDYALALSQLLACHTLPPGCIPPLRGLLNDVVSQFASLLCAPRWRNTPLGREWIDSPGSV